MPKMLSWIKNPASEWLGWLMRKLLLESRYTGLELRYLAKAHNCQFGKGNIVNEKSILSNSSLGDYSYVARECFLANTTVGKFCSIGPYVRAGLGAHPLKSFASTHPSFYSQAGQAGIIFADGNYFQESTKVSIGNDVWIGANALILDGIIVGNGAVVGGGSVVTTDVPPYAIVGGVPAKIIKYRFSDPQIKELLNLQWWDRDVDWLRSNFKRFHNIDFLLET